MRFFAFAFALMGGEKGVIGKNGLDSEGKGKGKMNARTGIRMNSYNAT